MGFTDELSVDFADAHAADGAVPRNVGDEQGCGRAVNHQDVGVVDHIRREEQADDLNFVHKTLGEEGAEGAVAKSGGEDFLFRGAAFALEVSAGEFARRGESFAVVDSEREEVLPVAQCARSRRRNEQVGFAYADSHRAVRLLGD